MPVTGVKVDLVRNRVSEIADPATTIKYENIPVALYYSERHRKVVIARSEATWQSREIASLRSQ